MIERKKIGVVGVDARMIWVGDPCYILFKETENQKVLGKNWGEFCKKIEKGKFDENGFLQFNYVLGHPGLGVAVHSGYGDGTYPVYATFKDGRVRSVTVRFF